MKKLLNRKNLIIVATLFVISMLSGVVLVSSVPNQIILFEGEKLSLGNIFTTEARAETDNSLAERRVDSDRSYLASVKFAGIIPIKTVRVSTIQKCRVIPGGECIGIKLYTDGLMVVGVSDFASSEGKMVSPARNSGIKTGDIIKRINGQAVDNADSLTNEVCKSDGEDISVDILRGDDKMLVNITPVADADNEYKIGLWVRNSVAGIGTMTFYNPLSNTYGALGHGIADSDTNNIVPIGKGEVIPARINTIKKGERGVPGELRGIFGGDNSIGKVYSNSKQGIYGPISDVNVYNKESIEVASRDEIVEGKAHILTCIEGNTPEKFEIEILKISAVRKSESKCMVLKITDPVLLEKTGGILQGMSGSPIVQNGKLVGAVTHVFINDPTRGYGIFIENMIAEAERTDS